MARADEDGDPESISLYLSTAAVLALGNDGTKASAFPSCQAHDSKHTHTK